jgi:hypothetical protein
MDKDEKRLLQRKRLMDNKIYQTMNDITRYMDRYSKGQTAYLWFPLVV